MVWYDLPGVNDSLRCYCLCRAADGGGNVHVFADLVSATTFAFIVAFWQMTLENRNIAPWGVELQGAGSFVNIPGLAGSCA